MALQHVGAVAAFTGLALAGAAHAHFALNAPAAYSAQDSLGLPQKSAPCGQADPGIPLVPTNILTSFHSGDTITVTIDEKLFHPGHYRVALAQDQKGLPADPFVTPGATPCGTAQIQDSTTPGVLADDMLPHTTAFSGPQSFQVHLPDGVTCTNCTLQVIEFMSDHALNAPGGCFYHHCAQVSVLPQGTPLPPAQVNGSGGSSRGCSSSVPGLAGALVVLAALRRSHRRRADRRRCSTCDLGGD